MGNLFQEALDILEKKSVAELSPEEETTLNAATIVLDHLPEFDEKSTCEGLEVLARGLAKKDLVSLVCRQEAARERLRQSCQAKPARGSEPRCDFACNKRGKPLQVFYNINGHLWVCHLSCLKEDISSRESRR